MADVKPLPTEGSNEMVERVAIAIFVSWYDGSPMAPVAFYTDCDDVLQADYRRIARAAIEAMREPTEAVCEVGRSVEVAGDEANRPIGWVADRVWSAMIDAALIEPNK